MKGLYPLTIDKDPFASDRELGDFKRDCYLQMISDTASSVTLEDRVCLICPPSLEFFTAFIVQSITV